MNNCNPWTKRSIEIAQNRDYLDQLFKVYPMSINPRRKLGQGIEQQIVSLIQNRDDTNILNLLLKQELFPIKDSYVAYLKRDPSAINRNPKTIKRLTSIIYDMGEDEVIKAITQPKETNRQIGPLFKEWINKKTLGADVTSCIQEFSNNEEKDMILNASDATMETYARQYLGYAHPKGLDFVARYNSKYVIGEAKFLSDYGGHQNAQLADAMSVVNATLAPTDKEVIKIAILDGVLYIPGQSKMFLGITKDPKINIMSSLVLRDFLFSL